MSRISKFIRLQTDGCKGAALAAVLGLCFFAFPLGDTLKNLSYELPFLFRRIIPVNEVHLLYMDDDSHQRLGQKWDQPWDRSLHTQLLKYLTTHGAKAVVFDILFDLPSTEITDAQFLRAVTNHGRVILSTKAMPFIQNGNVIGMKLVPLFTNIFHWGVAEISGEDDIIRQHYRDKIAHAPSLAWTTAQLTMANPPNDLSQPRWLNYYGPPGAIPYSSYYEVLSDQVSVADISNKVVFVGALYSTGFSGGTGTDDFRTPFTRWTGLKSPGVEVSATAYLNLLKGDWLIEMPLLAELVVLILLGISCGYGLTLCRPMLAVGIGFGAAVIVAAFAIVVVWQTRFWFPWLIVCSVQVPAALGWSILAHTKRLNQEKEALAEQLTGHPAHAVLTPEGTIPVAPAVARFAERYVHASAGLSSGFQPAEAGVTRKDSEGPPPIPDHTLLRCIGQGAYGKVWIARDAIGTYHAVKIVYRDNFKEAGPFEREFRGIQKFTPISRSHPGFVHILHVGSNEEAGYFYYIMELGDDVAAGQQIDPDTYSPQNLAQKLKKSGKLPIAECLQISLDLASALEHLHQRQLIHRDIKPSNIIFVNHLPKFADIGLVTDLAGKSTDVSFVGTQGYLAPEGPGTASADVYSLGKLLYEASTGLDRARFPELPTALLENDETPLLFQLNKIILRACETDAQRRYQSAAAMREDLLHLQQAGWVEKKRSFWRRRG